LRFASLHILTRYFSPLIAALAYGNGAMKHKVVKPVVMSLILLLSEIALGNNIFQSGESNVNEKLQEEALIAIKESMSNQGCENINYLAKNILKKESTTGTNGHVWGKEGWMVFGCGKSFPYYIFLIEDGNDKSYVEVKSILR
jgi:hypothetical protein